MKKRQLIFRIASIIVLTLWIIFNDWDFWEPTMGIITVIAYIATEWYNKKVEDAEYSPAYALAYGYVNNFLFPAITQILENDTETPKLCIYRPNDLEDLYPENIDRIKAEIKNRSFSINEIQLDLKQGRARDILTIEKSSLMRLYFDFPNTLTSLVGYVDYKVESVKNESVEQKKKELGDKLIKSFFSKLEELVKQKKFEQYIDYCDTQLNILNT
jgi:nucleotide-binding STING sensor domain-containing protein